MIKRFLNKDDLLKHVFTLVKGTVLAQIIGLSAQFWLRRMFTVADFGAYALYVAVVFILYSVSTGRYEMAIVLPKDDNEANGLLKLSIIIPFIFSSLLFIVLLFLNNHIVTYVFEYDLIDSALQSQEYWLKISIFLLPAGVFLLAVYNALNYWFTRQRKYSKIVNVRISNSVTNVGATTSFGLLNYSFGGVIMGYVMAQLIGVAYFLKLRLNDKQEYSRVSYKELMINYKDFPTKSMFSGLLNILASQLPIIMMGVFFGYTIVGLYEIIIRILNVPITMVGKSVSQVFFQKISEDVKNNVDIGPYVNSFSKKLFIFMLIPMAIIFFFGDWLFVFTFGEQYRISGELSSYFALFFLVRFVYYSLSTLYIVKRKIGIELKQNGIYLSSQIIALLVGYYYYNDFRMTFILLALSGFLCYVFFMFSLLKLANSK